MVSTLSVWRVTILPTNKRSIAEMSGFIKRRNNDNNSAIMRFMKNVVTIGGGTGSYTVLSGLKDLKGISISALVSMADDGGSTGKLRDELGVMPTGDVRQCLLALSEQNDAVRKLMGYRFGNGSLSGHGFGNILLAGLEKITGDFDEGVAVASELLKVKGTVIPITLDNAESCALLPDGTVVRGQVNIGKTNLRKLGLKKLFYKKPVRLNPNARSAILKADYIIIGPGDYFESLVPNFIVSGFKEAIVKSKAKIILPVNFTNKKIHTKYWKASDYVKTTESYIGRPIDMILVNNEPPSPLQMKHYKLKTGDGVLVVDDLKDERVIRKSLMSSTLFNHIRSFIRHDSKKLAKCIDAIIKK